MITPDIETPDLRDSRPETLGSPGTAGRLAGLFRALTGAEPPVRLRAWDDSVVGPEDAPELVVTSPAALRRLAWRPNELGLAQAYVTGELDVRGDVADGLRRVWRSSLAAGGGSVGGSVGGWPGEATGGRPIGRRSRLSLAARAARPGTLYQAWRLGALGRRPAAPASQARLAGRMHTRRRDRDAIAFHYDLSNDFYALILDSSMAYSCAYWPEDEPGLDLAAAQRAKLDLICRKLDLRPGQALLDVGCGWGSLILHAAEHYGVTAVGVTLSAEQAAFVHDRIRERGLAARVEVRTQHFQDFPTSRAFDAVASIEMGEHVGEAAYPAYAARLRALVRPGGRLLLQQMSRGRTAPGGGAFIESFIAPDMHMRPLGTTVGMLERAGWEILGVQALRPHYVRTIRAWLATLEERWSEVVDLVGVEVARVWRLYLAGSALAFEDGRMGVDQILAVRADGMDL